MERIGATTAKAKMLVFLLVSLCSAGFLYCFLFGACGVRSLSPHCTPQGPRFLRRRRRFSAADPLYAFSGRLVRRHSAAGGHRGPLEPAAGVEREAAGDVEVVPAEGESPELVTLAVIELITTTNDTKCMRWRQ